MVWTVVEKEIRSVLASPKFAATFVVCSALILLSITLGVSEYRAFEAQRAAGLALDHDELEEAQRWADVRPHAYRPADPLQVFVSGVHNDIGRFSAVAGGAEIKLERGVYQDDPAKAIFRMLDLGFIVTTVLSLFAVLFTFDAVSGERESGTLRLVLSNPIPRSRFILGKLIGTWLGLVVPLTLPLILGVLGVALAGVSLTGPDWIRLIVLLGAAGLYFSVWVAIGLAVSVASRSSSSSFLRLLAIWVVAVLVLPRAGLTAASHLRLVPSVAEIESDLAAFENAHLQTLTTRLSESWQRRSAEMEGMDQGEQDAYEDEHLWRWMEEDDEQRRTLDAEIAEHRRLMIEDLRNRKAGQTRLALALARPSPAAAFNIVATVLAGTDHALKDRTEDTMRRYQAQLNDFVEAKAGQAAGGRRIVVRRGSGSHFGFSSDDGAPVDLTEMPVFTMPTPEVSPLVAAVIPDLGLLSALSFLGFAVAFVTFLRADVVG